MMRRDVLKMFSLALAAVGFLGLQKADMNYQLGKLPAHPAGVKLNLGDYLTPSKLPTPPENFGHDPIVRDWGMLGNDKVGDCAVAGPFHAEMLWCAEGKKRINVTTKAVLEAYSAITGYDPHAYDPITKQNPTDNGSDVRMVNEYWRTRGLRDADGKRHKIDCYLALEPGNLEQLFHALYLFDGVGIGIECPQEFQQAFFRGEVWDALPHPTIEGGHYILGVGRRNGLINTVTWGRTQLMTPAAYQQFSDETYVHLSREKLINGKSLEGFNAEQLMADIADLADEAHYHGPPICN